MKAKSVLILLVLVAVLAFFALRKGGRDWEENESRTILPESFPTEEIALVEIAGQGHSVSLEKGIDGVWGVRERGGYPADLRQLWQFVVTMTQLRMAEPLDLTVESAEDYGLSDAEAVTAVLRNAEGVEMASIRFGRKTELSGEELGGEAAAYGAEKIPVGRYVQVADFAALVPFTFALVDVPVAAWLDKEFVHFSKVKRVECDAWALSRTEAQAQLVLEGEIPAGKQVDAQKLGMLQGILGRLQFEDVQKGTQGWAVEKTLRVEEFGGTVTTLHIGPATDGLRPVSVEIDGNADSKYAGWTFLMRERALDLLLVSRKELLQEQKDE